MVVLMKHALPTFALIILLSLGSVADAQTSYPMVMSLHPVAAQVGQTSEHTVKSRYTLYGSYRVIVSGEGVTGEVVHPEKKPEDAKKTPNLTSMKLRFTVTPDAEPGVREFRVATPRGVSTVGQLVIARDTIVVEKGKNDTREQAQAVTTPATVCGVIEKAEDVDFYKFTATAGQSLSFHVRSMRLQNKIHDLQKHSDPIMFLRNESGSVIASSDNHFYGDPFLSHRFEQAGEYFIEIRDVRYQGNAYWEYSIEISGRPFISNVYPLGVAPGKDVELELVGAQLPAGNTSKITIPAGLSAGSHALRLPMGEELSSPVSVVVSNLPLSVEGAGENNTVETAQAVTVPGGISGRIERKDDIDCYSFEAKKGEKYSFEVIARRLQSGLDSNLRILDATGKRLIENDDLKLNRHSHADSWVETWTAPADGKFFIEIRDLHLRGGAEFTYFINVTHPQPYFELYLDTDKTQLTPGTAGAIFARIVRKNGFTGEVQLHIDGLPPGVKATAGRIPAGKSTDGCIVLEAAADAKMDVANITVTGTAKHELADGKMLELSSVAHPMQETYQPGGGRGHWPVGTHAVSIGEPNDILSIKLSTYELDLKPGESKTIEVTLVRAPEFKANVQLDLLYRHLSSMFANTLPEGVTIDTKTSKTLLTGTNAKGQITLTAAATAPPIEKRRAVVMANVSLNFVMKATYSSAPLTITVAKKDNAAEKK